LGIWPEPSSNGNAGYELGWLYGAIGSGKAVADEPREEKYGCAIVSRTKWNWGSLCGLLCVHARTFCGVARMDVMDQSHGVGRRYVFCRTALQLSDVRPV
jgi:hypothetical protein